MQNTLRNKYLYKIFLSILKFIPNVLALLQIIALCLNYFNITSFAITCIGGTSIIFLGILYLMSFLFQFCGIYRLSLHYVSTIYVMTLIDYYIGIPLSLENMYYVYAFISGVFMISWIIIWYKNRKNPKIDHIKQLCDTYSDCGC